MIEKFRAVRPASGSPSNLVGQIAKRPNDQLDIAVDFDELIDDGDYISTVTLSAEDLDSTDATSTILDSTTGGTVSGTATGGSTTTLIDTTKNFALLGVRAGDRFVNVTKGWTATVKRIYKTTNAGDTIEFDEADTAAASSDSYKFLFATAGLKAGTTGTSYRVRFGVTTNAGSVFQETVLLNVLI